MPLSFSQYWSLMKAHPLPPPAMTQAQVEAVVRTQWASLRQMCGGLGDARIDVVLDDGLEGSGILAWASRTHVLEDDVWVPSVLSRTEVPRDMLIGVNPGVPNGWALGCDQGLRFDLNSVIMHELLHGVGVSSSVTPDRVGYDIAGKCFPNMLDTKMEDATGTKLVHGCTYHPSEEVYVGGEKLFNPADFIAGSSLAHTDARGVMYYSIPPETCLEVQDHDLRILNSLGLDCSPATRVMPMVLTAIFALVIALH